MFFVGLSHLVLLEVSLVVKPNQKTKDLQQFSIGWDLKYVWISDEFEGRLVVIRSEDLKSSPESDQALW